MILPPKKYVSKHQNKAEFKNLEDSEVPSSDILGLRTSAASMTSTASTTLMTSKYAGLLGRWDKRLVNQVSDIPSIFFHNFL